MGMMSIDELKGRIRANALPADGSVTIEIRRAAMEAVAFRTAGDISVEPVTVAGIAAQWVRAPDVNDARAVLYCHGGGYVMGSLNTHCALAGEVSRAAAAPVLLFDYRLAPEAPFPAAVDDAVAAFEWLLEQGFAAENTAIAGDSAGGGLTAATLVALRDRGLPLPRAGVCISPWSDLTCTNPSYETRAAADPMIAPADVLELAACYVQDNDARHPLISPNFADLTGLPPLLIHVGRDEVLLDDAIALHARAEAHGVDATLEVWDDMIHVWHAFHPVLDEGRRGVARIGAYLQQQWT